MKLKIVMLMEFDETDVSFDFKNLQNNIEKGVIEMSKTAKGNLVAMAVEEVVQ